MLTASNSALQFCSTYQPPTVLGAAALTTAAMRGMSLDGLTADVARADVSGAAWLYDTSILHQLAVQREVALAMQHAAISASTLFRIGREPFGRPAIKLLALVAPGDLMVNTPLDFLTNHLDVQLDLLFLMPGRPLPDVLPEHDLMFVAISEADPALLARVRDLCASWPRPVLNDPAFLPALARHRLPRALAGIPGLCSPPAVSVRRDQLEALQDGVIDLAGLLPNAVAPFLLRPAGTHAGAGLTKIDDHSGLSAYLLNTQADTHTLTQFIDYRSADGLYRKYRVALIDGQAYLCHLAISEHWMVHYLNAGMTVSAEKRGGEAAAMASFDSEFGARHRTAFAALFSRLPFDMFSIDCAELPDGRLLVFEADTAAIIHAMDPDDMFPYKLPQMKRIFNAFDGMLRRRMAGQPLLLRPWCLEQ